MSAPGEALDDHEIFRRIADRLGVGEDFTEGRTPRQWLEHLREVAGGLSGPVPPFDQFWSDGGVAMPYPAENLTMFEKFRSDPDEFRLRTPTGRIELRFRTSSPGSGTTIAGHPAWIERGHRCPGTRCTSSPTSHRPDCMVRWTSARTAWPARSRDAADPHQHRRCPRLGSRPAMWSVCSTIAVPAWPVGGLRRCTSRVVQLATGVVRPVGSRRRTPSSASMATPTH